MTRKRLLLLSVLVVYPAIRVVLHIAESLTVFPHSTSFKTLLGHWIIAAIMFLPAGLVAARPHAAFGRTLALCLLLVTLTLGLLDGPWLLTQHGDRLKWAKRQAEWDFGRYLLAAIPTAGFIAYAGRRGSATSRTG